MKLEAQKALIETDRRAILGLKHYAEDIIASLPTGLIVVDDALKVLTVNRSFRELFGQSNGEDLSGRDLEDILPLPRLRQQAQGVLASGTVVHGIDATCSEKKLRLAIAGIRLAEEDRLLVVVEDVSEEQKLREQARAHKARYRDLVQDLNAIVWEADPATFTFTFVSRRAETILGHPVERWLTEPDFWANLIHPEDREQTTASRRAATAQSSGQVLVYRAVAADGRVVWLHDIAHVVCDEKGRVQRLHGVMVDIGARKQAERALVLQKDLYAVLSQTNQTIVRGSSREELFAAMCRIAVEHGHFLFAWIGVIDKDDRRLRPVARYGEDAGYVNQLRVAVDDASATACGISGEALRTGRHAISNDFLADPVTAPWHEAARRAGVRAMASFPLRQGGAVIGVIDFYAGEPGFFTEALLATLDEMATDVSFALDNFEREAKRKRAEVALRQSEARYRSLFDNMLDAFAYCRMEYDEHDRPVDFVYLEVNDSFERLTGLKDVVGKLVTEVIPGIRESNPELFDIYGRVATTGVPETFETYVEPLRHWFSISVYGPEKGYFVAVFDVITERKRAEVLLRESEERLRTIFEGALDGILVADAESEKFVTGNSAICRMLGYTPEEIARLGVSEIHRDQDLPHVREIFERLLHGESQLAADIPVMRKDGSVFYADIRTAPIRLGGRNCLLGVFRDITERKRFESELAEAEAQFRGLVEQSIAGIYIIQDHRYAYVNPRFAEILGYGSADELIGREGNSIVAEKDLGVIAEIVRQRNAGETQNLKYGFTALRKDGATVELGLHSAEATFRGRPATIGLMQDISEKKRAEEQIKSYLKQLESAFMHTVEVAMTLGEMRDPYTAGHERRVAEIAVAIGTELGFDDRRREGLRVAGYLHDIGKITIPSEILAKPGKLTAIEFELIKAHPQASYDVLKNVEFPWPVAEIVLQHHERPDGSGYPRGLKSEAILLEARIMAVADVIEAMSSHRPYRPGLGIDKALAEIERGRGSAYDAAATDACLRLFREKGYALPA